MYIERKIDYELLEWSREIDRKPLLLRGARQVGKSTAVRQLSKNFKYYLEVNFEQDREVKKFFEDSLDPKEICNALSVYYNIPIIPSETLVFLDEIQSSKNAISSLRFFYEKFPELHLIAAGSLLEFALETLPSFGVGRIRSLFMYPFSFSEFLVANNERLLLEAIEKASFEHPLNDLIHTKALSYLKKFFIIGGMPEVVSKYIQTHDLLKVQDILNDLYISYKSDFAKYKSRVPALRIQEVFHAIVNQAGERFVYNKAIEGANNIQIKEAVELLIMAGLVIPVTHSSANGIPIGSELNIKKRKMIVFDTGIYQRILGLNLGDFILEDDLSMVNRGALAEQYVGLELIKSLPSNLQESLYFWQRETSNSNAEVDYIIQKGFDIIPIEVKSGTRGKMQSLNIFLNEKKIKYGYRTSSENFGEFDNIKVLPLYSISSIRK